MLDLLLSERDVLLADGAMGTELFARGLDSGGSPELWNVEHADRVQAVHADFVAAGSDIVLTNSFGGTAFRLKLHELDRRVHELNAAAASNARAVADAADRTVIVAGSMGPTGELLVPMGDMTYEACRDAFADQAKGLAEGGADLLWIETMSHLDEVAAAIEGARSVCDLPICATLSFDTAGRTMMGVTATGAAIRLAELGVVAAGANCGNNLADTEAALTEMRVADPDAVLISKANAGIPDWHGAELRYSGSPDVMAAHAARQRGSGVRIIGGCCGSSPAHIALMRSVIDGDVPVPDVAFTPAVERPTSTRTRRGRARAARTDSTTDDTVAVPDPPSRPADDVEAPPSDARSDGDGYPDGDLGRRVTELFAAGGSQMMHEFGLVITHAEPGFVRFSLPVAERLTHAGGVLSGQAIMACMDTGMVFVMMSLNDASSPAFTTIELKTSFERGVPADVGEVTFEARATKPGRTLVFGQVDLLLPNGTRAASATTTYMWL